MYTIFAFVNGLELEYKNISHKIIAEEYIENINGNVLEKIMKSNQIKGDKMEVSKKIKRYNKKKKYERFEDLSNGWKKVKDDEMEEVKDFKKFEKGYDVDDKEEFEEENKEK